MNHIRMILKHLCLSGMLGKIQSKITRFQGYILLPLLCSMSLISPNFGQGPFRKIAGKSPGRRSLLRRGGVQIFRLNFCITICRVLVQDRCSL